MQTGVSGILAQQQTRYKRYLDRNASSLTAFNACQRVYVNEPALTTLAPVWQTSAKYDKLMLRRTGQLKVLEVRDQVLTIDKNEIANTNLIDIETRVGSQDRQLLLESKKYRRRIATL